MGQVSIFSGNDAKLLKPNLDFFGNCKILTGSVDPTSVATAANKGSLYLNNSTSNIYKKNDNGTTTNWTIFTPGNNTDLADTAFAAANNQAVAANVTGLAFPNATVRSFEALVSVYVNATASLYEAYTIRGIQRGADWQMSQTTAGDASGFVFTITTAGQVQYTSNNYAGFVSATIRFRAFTLST